MPFCIHWTPLITHFGSIGSFYYYYRDYWIDYPINRRIIGIIDRCKSLMGDLLINEGILDDIADWKGIGGS